MADLAERRMRRSSLRQLAGSTELGLHAAIRRMLALPQDETELAAFTPAFLWLLRDFYLRLEEDGRQVGQLVLGVMSACIDRLPPVLLLDAACLGALAWCFPLMLVLPSHPSPLRPDPPPARSPPVTTWRRRCSRCRARGVRWKPRTRCGRSAEGRLESWNAALLIVWPLLCHPACVPDYSAAWHGCQLRLALPP